MTSNKLSRGSLQEKNGIWQAVFSKGGKTIWRSTGVKAVRGNKKKAQARLDEIRKELEECEPDKDMLFVDFILIWLENHRNRIREISYIAYEGMVNTIIIPYFKELNLKLSGIKVFHIDNFLQYLWDNKGVKICTIKSYKNILNLVLNEAVRQGIINNNPCQYSILPIVKDEERQEKKKFLTVDEVKRIMELCEGKPIHDMILFSFIYGLRREELMGLRWDDIDFEENTIIIRNTVTVIGKFKFENEMTKTKKSQRTYPILPQIKEALTRMKEQQIIDKEIYGADYIECNKVFRKNNGKEFYPDYARQSLRAVEKKHNLPPTSFHCLRHSCASYLMSIGWHPKDISDWLGHSNISTTMNIYTHSSIDRKREIASKLGEI